MRTRHVVICLAMLTVLIGAAPRNVEAPAAAAADPERYAVVSGDYTVTGLQIDGFPARVPVTGHYVVPEGAQGPRPFALFLHGKHATCYRSSDGAEFSSWPCPRTADPIPSHLGYRYLQRLLAWRGYVTVSVMANGVDGQEDFHAGDAGVATRSALVRRHLRLWEAWTTGERPGPDGTDWTGRVDLDRTLLVGHSRGGEGVVRAAVDTLPAEGWRVRGLVLLAPANNTRQVAPRVPTTVLMGYCDGDLNFWPGQGYLDVARDIVPDPALRTAVSLTGANHAYFNTEWTPRLASTPAGDDGSNFYSTDHPLCGRSAPTRLSAAEQRAVTATYLTAAAEVYVDGETTRLRLFDGRLVKPRDVAGAHVSVSPLGGYRVLVRPRIDATLSSSPGATARLCRGYAADDARTSCGRGLMFERTPHWLPSFSSRATPTASAAELRWTERGARAGLVARAPVDLGSSTHLDARVVVDPAAGPVRLAFRVTDVDGDAVVLEPRLDGRLEPMPGPGRLLRRLWGQTLRAPLAGLDEAGVDRTAIASVELVSRNGSGRVWLLEASGWREGSPELGDTYVPRVNVLDVQAPEGGEGERVLDVPLTVTGVLTGTTVIEVQLVDELTGEAPTPMRVVLEAGDDGGVIPISYVGDTTPGQDRRWTVNVWARSGAVVGRQQATATAVDDD